MLPPESVKHYERHSMDLPTRCDPCLMERRELMARARAEEEARAAEVATQRKAAEVAAEIREERSSLPRLYCDE